MGKFQKVGFAFSIIPDQIINDKRLSWKAKGIYTQLASKPNGWQFSTDRIAKNGTDGKKAVRSGLQELEKFGYLERKRHKTGRVEYILYSDPQSEKATVPKRHCAKTALLSKKNCIKKNKNTLCASSGLRTVSKQKSMKNTEQVIELDEYGEPLPPRDKKTKVPMRLIQKVALHYATLFNVPKENLYFKYKTPILEMVNLSKAYYGDDFSKIQDEIILRITVAKKYMEFKKWGKMKLATIAESWNEIPKWAKEIEV